VRAFAEVSKARGLAWTLGATGISAGLLGFVALQKSVSATTFIAIAALVTTLSFVALTRGAPTRGRRRATRRVGADGRGLSVDGQLVVPRHALARARVSDEPDGSHSIIVEARGLAPSYVLRVGSARIAQAFADTLEQRARDDDVAVFRALPPWAHRMRALTLILTTSPWILFNVLQHLPHAAIFVTLGLYGLIGLPVILPQKVMIGEDGVLLRWAGRRRFIPFGALRAARATPLGVSLELADERTVEIRLTQRADAEPARREAILERIGQGLDVHEALEPAEDEALLARGERAVDAWIEEMRVLGSAHAYGYRTIALPRDRLWSVLENPGADPSARQGAALALREHLDDEERERLMMIGQKSASPRVRVAIDAVTNLRDTERLRVVLEDVASPQHGVDERLTATRR
jgi:hypothetical protein